jgi:hypothetical protein
MPDGSIFDTIWLIFLRHMAHFYAPRGSLILAIIGCLSSENPIFSELCDKLRVYS